jgi:AmmeMemoRadiSam system protein B
VAEALRSARMAGTWYPGDAASLRVLLSALFKQASEALQTRDPLPDGASVVGLQAPHAGILYSGLGAAMAYASLGNWRPARVVVLAPSHRQWVEGVNAWSPVKGQALPGEWETPLGRLTVDHAFLRRLGEECPILSFGPAGHGQEHALELQLPFLQMLGVQAPLVPLCVGSQEAATARALAHALHLLLTEDAEPTLLVASSDLSHFHTLDQARQLDGHYLDLLTQADPVALLDALATGACEACGGAPAAVLLELFRLRGRGVRVEVLDWRSSAHVTHDAGSVVGYAAVRMWEKSHA